MNTTNTSSLSTLSSLQRGVLDFYLGALGPPATQVQLHRAGWAGEIGGRPFGRREIVVAQVVLTFADGDRLHFFGSLGDSEQEIGAQTNHEHQFICTFDSANDDIVHMVAYARVHHLSASVLIADSSFLLDESNALRRRGYTNVLVTRADLHAPFRDRNSADVAGKPMQFLGLLPLEEREWEVKVKRGTDALFDDFAVRRRDILVLNS